VRGTEFVIARRRGRLVTAPRRVLLAAPAAAVLAACAAKSNLVVVLPEADGHVGAVVVHDAKGDRVLDQAYAAAGSGAGAGALRPVEVAPQEVTTLFGPALAARPIAPKSFTLYFISDSDQLTEASRAAFEDVFAEVARRKAAEVVVTGHTDRAAEAGYNDTLSLQRAKAVRQLFIARGLPPELVIAAGRGERAPLVPSADGVREARNRRVEITVR
jgi:outer membrane protein OmpA-like peptidoglycan-associated protein